MRSLGDETPPSSCATTGQQLGTGKDQSVLVRVGLSVVVAGATFGPVAAAPDVIRLSGSLTAEGDEQDEERMLRGETET